MKKRFILSALAGVMLSIGSSCLVLADENEDNNLEQDTSVLLRNNYTDSSWDFNMPKLQGNVYTNSRLKTDKSRSYAKSTAIGKGKIAVWTERANGGNIGTSEYVLKQGQSVKIYNRAYEMYGRTNIRLGVKAANLEFVKIHSSGKWSPDSI